MLEEMSRSSPASRELTALSHLIRNERGFDLHNQIQSTKVGLSAAQEAGFAFYDGPIEIEREVERESFERWIEEDLAAIEAGLDRLLVGCAVAPAEVGVVFLTGGSAFVPAVRDIFGRRFGSDRLRGGDELTTVARGLAVQAIADA